MKKFSLFIMFLLCSMVLSAHNANGGMLQTTDMSLSDTRVFFDAEGGSDAHIRVTCNETWYISVSTGKDWLKVSKNGDLLIVECLPNNTTEQRNGEIHIFAVFGCGTIVGKVLVQQEKGNNQVAYTSPDKPKSSENKKTRIKVLSKTEITFRNFEVSPKILDYNNNIDRTVEILKENPNFKLQIEAYTAATNRGTTYELDLTQRRAEKVRQVFIDKGVNPSQISTSTHTSNYSENGISKAENTATFRITVN